MRGGEGREGGEGRGGKGGRDIFMGYVYVYSSFPLLNCIIFILFVRCVGCVILCYS